MIINGTPHEVVIYSEFDCIFNSAVRKIMLAKEDATPLYRIPAGIPLNAKTWVSQLTNPEFPFLRGAVEFLEADPLPGEEGDIVIVSNLYRSALKELGRDTHSVATVGGTVYSNIDNPLVLGCLYLNFG